MNRLSFVAARMFNTPLMIHPKKVEVVMSALAERLGIVSLDNLAPRPAMMESFDENFDDRIETVEPLHGYEVVNGVAVIEVHGTLVNKLGTLRPYSGMTGYDGIRQNLLVAMGDEDVKAIAFDFESGGGEVAGCFDLTDLIYELRGRKPMWAILSEYAYSAAYCLASATDKIVVPRTGGVGSIGVICGRVDYSKALKNGGIAVNFIHYGEKKTHGYAETKMSDEERDDTQDKIDVMGDLFVETVARNLRIPKESVINTQAGCFMGQEAVDAGFAHAVMSPDEAFRSLVKSLT